MARIDPLEIEVEERSDRGLVRESNQDASSVAVSRGKGRLLFVADGMGGHAGGETASRMAVEVVTETVETTDAPGDALLVAAISEANRRIHQRAREDAHLGGMGTTGVALLFEPGGTAWVANVGDSRGYRLRDGVLLQLTSDHSLVAELQRRGLLTAEEALRHPRRNEVLRSIGVDPDVEIDVDPVDVRAGDQFLLCSDGLSGVVSDREIAAVLGSEPPKTAVDRLVEAANAQGGPDNVTVQIARIPSPASRRGKRRGARAVTLAALGLLLLSGALRLLF